MLEFIAHGFVATIFFFGSWRLCGSQPGCSEPPPVGNAYRRWDGEQVTYQCFHTYRHVQGDLARTCDPATKTYNGTPPVCLLNCSTTTWLETDASVAQMNGTLAPDQVVYQCHNGTLPTALNSSYCSSLLGTWSRPKIFCHDTSNIVVPGSAVLWSPADNDSFDVTGLTYGDDVSSNRSLTLPLGSNLTFNLSDNGGQTDVYSLTLTFRITVTKNTSVHNLPDVWPSADNGTTDGMVQAQGNVSDAALATGAYYLPCAVTTPGGEYAGDLRAAVGAKTCQRWDAQLPHGHNFTDDALFPADGSVSAAENRCRNPNGSKTSPWCFTTDPKVPWSFCDVPQCVQMRIQTIYLYLDGREQTDWCSESDADLAGGLDLRDAVDAVHTRTFACISPSYTSRQILPFGHQLRLVTSPALTAAVSLQVYQVTARGRPHTEGCGAVLGYNGLQLEGEPPNASAAGTQVMYRCQTGWHYRGGPLFSTCLDSRGWSIPDLSRCFDDVNHAQGRAEPPLGNVTDNDCSTCTSPGDLHLNVTLPYLLEVREVIVTASVANDSYKPSVTVIAGKGSRHWPCETLTVFGTAPTTATFNCPFRPFSDYVIVTFSNFSTRTDTAQWNVCEVKIFGWNHSTALECRQTAKGREFKGRLRWTASGRECQRWDSQTPHLHPYNVSSLFPDVTVSEAHNYCRNPSEPVTGSPPWRTAPWCYTADPAILWEYCPVFYCNNICQLNDGSEYTGYISRIASGKSCKLWSDSNDMRLGHSQFLRNHYFPGSLYSQYNFCRNPHSSQTKPWCFTAKGNISELCSIPDCYTTENIQIKILDLDDNTTVPTMEDWLSMNNMTMKECWRFDTRSFQTNISRFLNQSTLLQSSCSIELQNAGVFCSFDTSNGSWWQYFWYNCTKPTASPQTVTKQVMISLKPTEAQKEDATLSVSSTTHTMPNIMARTCNCQFACANNLTRRHTKEILDQIRAELLLDINLLSSTLRKKTSIIDMRPTAITTGSFGVACIASVVAFIISSDVVSLVKAAHKKLIKLKKKKSKLKRKPGQNWAVVIEHFRHSQSSSE